MIGEKDSHVRHVRLQFLAAIGLTIGAIIAFSISGKAGQPTTLTVFGHSSSTHITSQ